MRSSFYAAQVGGGGIGGSTSLGGCVGSLSTLAQSESRTITKGCGGSYKLYGGRFFDQIDRTNPKSCLLKLPLEFQLAFFRILTRLLTEEGDEEYDEECLFDWSLLEKAQADAAAAAECTPEFLKRLSDAGWL